MFITAAGSSFYIGAARPDWYPAMLSANDFTDEMWTEIANVASLGRISGEWGLETATVVDRTDPGVGLWTVIDKGVRPTREMRFIIGFDPNDPGMLAMIDAENSMDAFPFRIVLDEGETRLFVALVVSMDDVQEDGRTTIGMEFGIVLQSNVVRTSIAS